jgi:hypothetical protein
MLQTTGADSVEIIVQWYVSIVNSTEIYPILDNANPLRTSTDDELIAILTQAKKTGLKTFLTLMLDPDWTLPEQNWCRGNVNHDPNCCWRGEIGIYWGKNVAICPEPLPNNPPKTTIGPSAFEMFKLTDKPSVCITDATTLADPDSNMHSEILLCSKFVPRRKSGPLVAIETPYSWPTGL